MMRSKPAKATGATELKRAFMTADPNTILARIMPKPRRHTEAGAHSR